MTLNHHYSFCWVQSAKTSQTLRWETNPPFASGWIQTGVPPVYWRLCQFSSLLQGLHRCFLANFVTVGKLTVALTQPVLCIQLLVTHALGTLTHPFRLPWNANYARFLPSGIISGLVKLKAQGQWLFLFIYLFLTQFQCHGKPKQSSMQIILLGQKIAWWILGVFSFPLRILHLHSVFSLPVALIVVKPFCRYNIS